MVIQLQCNCHYCIKRIATHKTIESKHCAVAQTVAIDPPNMYNLVSKFSFASLTNDVDAQAYIYIMFPHPIYMIVHTLSIYQYVDRRDIIVS